MAFAPVDFIDGDPQQDFFEQNPQILAIDSFRKLQKQKDGSKLAWAIYYTEDPKSKFFTRDIAFRREKIAEQYLGDPDFNWDKLHLQICDYNEFCISRVARAYKALCDKYDEAQEIVMNHAIVDIKDVAIVNAAIYKQLDSMNDSLEKASDRLKSEIASQRTSYRGDERPGAFARRKS